MGAYSRQWQKLPNVVKDLSLGYHGSNLKISFIVNPSSSASHLVPPCQKHSSSQQKWRWSSQSFQALSTFPFVVWFQRSYSCLREIPLLLTSWILKDFTVYLLSCAFIGAPMMASFRTCQFPVSLPFALCLLQMLPIEFQMGFLYNILGCGEHLQKAANTWQCDPFRVKFNFSS